MHIKTISETMAEHGKELTVTDEALDKLVETGYSAKFGARFLKRTIDDIIKVPLTLKWKESNVFAAKLDGAAVVVSANETAESAGADIAKNGKNPKEKYKEEPDYV